MKSKLLLASLLTFCCFIYSCKKETDTDITDNSSIIDTAITNPYLGMYLESPYAYQESYGGYISYIKDTIDIWVKRDSNDTYLNIFSITDSIQWVQNSSDTIYHNENISNYSDTNLIKSIPIKDMINGTFEYHYSAGDGGYYGYTYTVVFKNDSIQINGNGGDPDMSLYNYSIYGVKYN